ncbi:unnamed protein product [Symbiodinium natans]|uniref:Sulfotransferase domain-containing protein n=1 Tax=Symbiodinium natans TaxID=878477 RepID=A0A812TK07_9DINO|nr:unnamed protein product [Symbiodinium natans]
MTVTALAAVFLALAPRTASFEVLYAGAPRSGTQTMYSALKIMGLNPIHSGYNLTTRPILCEYLYGNGSKEAAMNLFASADAAMDEPFQLMYEDVLKEFPNAKVVLPVMSAEDWYVSERNYFKDTVYAVERVAVEVAHGLKIRRNTSYEFFDAMWESMYSSTLTADKCWACRYWGCAFWKVEGMTPEENRTCLNNYEAHMDRVKALVPPSRLLVFNFSDGWAPLSHFLGRPVPDEPFPYTDKYNKDVAEETEAHAASFLQDGMDIFPTPRRSEL